MAQLRVIMRFILPRVPNLSQRRDRSNGTTNSYHSVDNYHAELMQTVYLLIRGSSRLANDVALFHAVNHSFIFDATKTDFIQCYLPKVYSCSSGIIVVDPLLH
jgi:hypothetical protein